MKDVKLVKKALRDGEHSEVVLLEGLKVTVFLPSIFFADGEGDLSQTGYERSSVTDISRFL